MAMLRDRHERNQLIETAHSNVAFVKPVKSSFLKKSKDSSSNVQRKQFKFFKKLHLFDSVIYGFKT